MGLLSVPPPLAKARMRPLDSGSGFASLAAVFAREAKTAAREAKTAASLAAVFAAAIDATDFVAASFRASAPLYIASTRAPIATNSPVVVVVGEENGRREPPKVVHKPPRNHKRTSCAWARFLGFLNACRTST